MMWYGCLTKQLLGGEVVYHCTVFGWVSNMMVWYWWYRTMIDSIYNLALSHCNSEAQYHCLCTQFWGRIVSPYNLGPSCISTQVRYGCLSKQFRGIFVYHCNLEVLYGELWYLWYVPWLVSKISFSLCKSGYDRGNNNVSLHNLGVELCLPTIWVFHVYLWYTFI